VINSEKEEMIRRCAMTGRDDWKPHAVEEAADEALTRSEVLRALANCEIIEDYPKKTRYLPDCLVLGWLADGRPLHAVVGRDELNDRILMITVYIPDPRRWENDWRTRKPKE
jgi:hypothetical protein